MDQQAENLKKLIARKREAAGQIKIEGIADGSAPLGMIANGTSLYVVTETSIHAVQMADAVDPDRTNPNIGITQQKILSRGSNSFAVYKTFLTADVLTKSGILPEETAERIVNISLNSAKSLCSVLDQLDLLIESERLTALTLASRESRSYSVIPEYMGAETLAAYFIQRCDHCFRDLLDIAKILYPSWDGKGYFDGFSSYLWKKENDSEFHEYLNEQLSFIKSTREIRNSVEHPKPDRKLAVRSYHLQPNGDISAPTIEVIHPIYRQPPIGLSSYIDAVVTETAGIYEGMLAMLFDRKGGSFGAVRLRVFEASEGHRRYGTVRYDLTIENIGTMASSISKY